MKIAFFGTSDKSLPILESLHKDFELCLCVTKEDTLVGRKQEVRETLVKKWAKEKNIKVFETFSIIKQKGELTKIVTDLQIELGIVADFSFMIPEEVISSFKYKMINIHFSLLPKLRGASPVQHSILNGLETTGITYYVLDKGMDTGPILFQSHHKLKGDENSKDLYDILFSKAGKEISDVINGYVSGKNTPKLQNEKEATYCTSKNNPKTTHILKEDAEIEWSDDAYNIERQIRAFNPWPISWTHYSKLSNNPKIQNSADLKTFENDKKVKIYEAELVENMLKINKLQLEGKNVIDWESFLNGYRKK